MTRGFVRSLATLALFITAFAVDSSAQAVYGSIARHHHAIASGGVAARRERRRSPAWTATPPTPSSRMPTVSTVKERLLPGVYEVKAELCRDSSRRSTAKRRRRRRCAGERGLQPRSRRSDARAVRSRDAPAAEDRPGRRRRPPRLQAAYRAPGARPELHQVHPADPRRTQLQLGARAEREPAGLHADHGQRAAFQRDQLPA